jgi:hypothetical protein
MSKLSFLFLILGSSLLISAQSGSSATSPSQSQKETFEPDTVFMVELNSSLDAAQTKPGQIITGTLHGDIWGKTIMLLPTGSKLIGHVVEAHGRSKETPESRLSVCFDKAHLKDGTEMSLNLIIRDLQVPPDVYVIRTGDDGLASLNASMSRAAGPTTDGHSTSYPSSSSGPISSNGHLGTGSSAPANRNIPPSYKQPMTINGAGGPSGLPDVDLVSTKQEPASFSLLTSTRREVKLKKHYIVFLVPAFPEEKTTK